jgi:hypothetical protein
MRGDSAQGITPWQESSASVGGSIEGSLLERERERESFLANSSSMQEVASTVTTGTGMRYDPDTESLVLTKQTSERSLLVPIPVPTTGRTHTTTC